MAVCGVCGRDREAKPKCPTCKGTGSVPLFTSVIPCKVCNGTGHKQLSDLELQRRISAILKCPGCRKKHFPGLGLGVPETRRRCGCCGLDHATPKEYKQCELDTLGS